MANFERVRLAGFWTLASVVLPEELELLDYNLSRAINGEGSVHAPTTPIIIGGEGVHISGNSLFDMIELAVLKTGGVFRVIDASEIVLDSGGVIRHQSGSRTEYEGGAELRLLTSSFINVQVGASIDIHGAIVAKTGSGFQLQSGASWVGFAGSTMTIESDVYFANNTWPRLSPARPWERHSLRICKLTYDTNGAVEPDKPDAWLSPSDLANGAECVQCRPTAVAGKYHWIDLTDLPNGGTISNVYVTTRGTSGQNNLALPTYKVVRWQGSSSTQDCSALITDVHTVANWFSGLLTTPIPITANPTIDKSYRYALIINHPYEAGVNGAMKVYDVRYVGTVSEIRV